jgi:hypothetical protein
VTPGMNTPGEASPATGDADDRIVGSDPTPSLAATLAEVEAVAAQTAADEEPVARAGSTTAGVAMVKTLLAAHSVLRRDLDSIRETIRLMASAVPGTPDGTALAGQVRDRVAALSMRQDAWKLKSFCDNYCQTVHAHHGIEDFRIFPAVVAVAPEIAPVVEQLTADHEELARLLDVLNASVGALPSAEAWAEAADAARELAARLAAHLDMEEKHILPPLGRLPGWV